MVTSGQQLFRTPTKNSVRQREDDEDLQRAGVGRETLEQWTGREGTGEKALEQWTIPFNAQCHAKADNGNITTHDMRHNNCGTICEGDPCKGSMHNATHSATSIPTMTGQTW